ncbi:hypothetical protein F444_02880 [Phytophthora nicotianae P1976]|uniref:BZIP domain-containing protein n=1 Tax=Phytophthora nicotianae P1976 TaxID=1317066 RepID=A0A081AVY9_PHYNI|nr:hypothetical protein F444_02880 [Phytophthora nicotianae P1976]
MPSRASKRCSTEAVSQESWYALPASERSAILHRQRRRRTQQRYRKKVQNKEVCLEDEVAQLQENVKRLEKQRDAISLSIPTKTATLNAVVEFFRLFRNGFHPVASVSDLCQASTSLKNDPAYVQTQFLQAITVHDFLSNAGYSVETALEDWRLISKQLENHSIELERVERGVGNSVVAYMNGVFTATETVLHSAFPELNTDSDGGKWAALAVKLLGKRLVVPSSFVFRFDDSNSRMLSAHYEADMLTPLLELLQSPGDVSLVLNSPLNVHHWSKE